MGCTSIEGMKNKITCFIFLLFSFCFLTFLTHINLNCHKVNVLAMQSLSIFLNVVLWFPNASLGMVGLLKKTYP